MRELSSPNNMKYVAKQNEFLINNLSLRIIQAFVAELVVCVIEKWGFYQWAREWGIRADEDKTFHNSSGSS